MNKDKDKNKSKPSRPWEALAAKWQAQAAADKAAGYTDLADLEARTAQLLAQVMQAPAPRGEQPG